MHELSIAVNIVEIAEEEVKKVSANRVIELILEIGSLSGVVKEAINFAMEEAVKGSVLEGSKIKIVTIEAIAKCSDCGLEYQTDDHWSVCPKCKCNFSDIIKGKETIIKSLIVE